mmetsp:Transcript_67811/g.214507  ORF Transcript_67811/g.214507 Transcript_67811/m.214507 type:complete len:328 (-) Transcript_67811:427-1410(-)
MSSTSNRSASMALVCRQPATAGGGGARPAAWAASTATTSSPPPANGSISAAPRGPSASPARLPPAPPASDGSSRSERTPASPGSLSWALPGQAAKCASTSTAARWASAEPADPRSWGSVSPPSAAAQPPCWDRPASSPASELEPEDGEGGTNSASNPRAPSARLLSARASGCCSARALAGCRPLPAPAIAAWPAPPGGSRRPRLSRPQRRLTPESLAGVSVPQKSPPPAPGSCRGGGPSDVASRNWSQRSAEGCPRMSPGTSKGLTSNAGAGSAPTGASLASALRLACSSAASNGVASKARAGSAPWAKSPASSIWLACPILSLLVG